MRSLRRVVEIASRARRWCDFPSLLSAVSGQDRIRISSPIETCSGCGRLYEVVCTPCERDRMERQEPVVLPFRAAGGGR